jgi:hypothetical protein
VVGSAEQSGVDLSLAHRRTPFSCRVEARLANGELAVQLRR